MAYQTLENYRKPTPPTCLEGNPEVAGEAGRIYYKDANDPEEKSIYRQLAAQWLNEQEQS